MRPLLAAAALALLALPGLGGPAAARLPDRGVVLACVGNLVEHDNEGERKLGSQIYLVHLERDGSAWLTGGSYGSNTLCHADPDCTVDRTPQKLTVSYLKGQLGMIVFSIDLETTGFSFGGGGIDGGWNAPGNCARLRQRR